MTGPNDEPGFLLRMILDKLEGLDRKFDSQTETVVSLRAETTQLRKEVDEIKADDKADRAVRRANGTFAVTTVLAVVAIVAPFLIR